MSTPRRHRLDRELVRRGLATSREQAQTAIAEHRVLVAGALSDKASRLVSPAEPIVVQGDGPRFVGRGGEKLAAALDAWAVDVGGRRALDAGASTGGFTDCLLQHGAASVVALDVGHGQLDARLRADPRVVVRERTDVRALDPAGLPPQAWPVDLVTADLSFISVRTVAPALVGLLPAGGDLVVLVKPQFEAGRVDAARGRGVIRDPAIWRRALEEACSALERAGAAIMGVMVSPITGSAGNVEFLVHATAGVPATGSLDAALDAAVAEAAHLAVRPGPPAT